MKVRVEFSMVKSGKDGGGRISSIIKSTSVKVIRELTGRSKV